MRRVPAAIGSAWRASVRRSRTPRRKSSTSRRGRELGSNEEGEICVRGPQVMKGYLNRPDATAAMIDADGWLHTGDIGYADEHGCFFVVDRLKELIKYKGMQIAPAELEAVLLGHPSIADAAVIPLADEEAGAGAEGVRGVEERTGARRYPRVRRRAGGALQEASIGRSHRPDTEVAVRKDPSPDPRGASAFHVAQVFRPACGRD